MLSVLQYAVEHLQVEHILVTGHYNCGGVNAAMQHKELGLIDNWLRNIRDVARLHSSELGAIGDASARFDRLVELNVQEQAINLFKTSVCLCHAQLERLRPECVADGSVSLRRSHHSEAAFGDEASLRHRVPSHSCACLWRG